MKREIQKVRHEIERLRDIVFEMPWDEDGNYKKGLSKNLKHNFEIIQNDFRRIYFRLSDMERECNSSGDNVGSEK